MIKRRQIIVILILIILSLFLLSGCNILGDLGGALQDSIDGIVRSFKF
jgi:predicted small secreted protein